MDAVMGVPVGRDAIEAPLIDVTGSANLGIAVRDNRNPVTHKAVDPYIRHLDAFAHHDAGMIGTINRRLVFVVVGLSRIGGVVPSPHRKSADDAAATTLIANLRVIELADVGPNCRTARHCNAGAGAYWRDGSHRASGGAAINARGARPVAEVANRVVAANIEWSTFVADRLALTTITVLNLNTVRVPREPQHRGVSASANEAVRCALNAVRFGEVEASRRNAHINAGNDSTRKTRAYTNHPILAVLEKLPVVEGKVVRGVRRGTEGVDVHFCLRRNHLVLGAVSGRECSDAVAEPVHRRRERVHLLVGRAAVIAGVCPAGRMKNLGRVGEAVGFGFRLRHRVRGRDVRQVAQRRNEHGARDGRAEFGIYLREESRKLRHLRCTLGYAVRKELTPTRRR
jgi:hypothetical protein